MNSTFAETLKPTLIYVFSIADEAHSDCLKIGETTLSGYETTEDYPPHSKALREAAHYRIDQYTKTAGIAYQLLYTELTLYTDATGCERGFHDTDVHQVLRRSGIEKKKFEGVEGANEWYCCSLETVKKAIRVLKEGRESLSAGEVATSAPEPIRFRPNQLEAIHQTVSHFRKAEELRAKGEKCYSRKMLWNAKMRFGKTFCALQVVKEMAFQRTLIITHRPVVNEGWFKDFQTIFAGDDTYKYGSKDKGESLESLQRLMKRSPCRYIYFASLQDLRGSELVGGDFDKNEEIFQNMWDLLIIDEAHEGTQTDIGQKVIDTLRRKKVFELHLSGTPFNLKEDFEEEETYTWDYLDEQLAKKEWNEKFPGEPNPYASLPALSIYTYDIQHLAPELFVDVEKKAFTFREFFRTVPIEGSDEYRFVHDDKVDLFLDLLCRDDEESLYPYATEAFRSLFRHTLWLLPGVKEAKALCQKLRSHEVFSQFDIVNVAGEGDIEMERGTALERVNRAIGTDSEATRSITLSCGRLTTGVTVPAWTGVFLLSGSAESSAIGYMQTIFRVQSPHTIRGRMKTDCVAFDFAPDRTLRLLPEMVKVSRKVGQQDKNDRHKLRQLLNFCPVIALKGSRMMRYNVNSMLQELKRVAIERVVNNGFEDSDLYNDELLKLTEVELKQFVTLHAIIGKTDPSIKKKKIDVNQQGFTNEEYEKVKRAERKKERELTPEEKEALEKRKLNQKNREVAISILRGISIRMPLMLYGAEIEGDEEEQLSIDNFTTLVDDVSWQEFMPKGVTKERFDEFKKYYDPDVFQGAGVRIRYRVKEADLYSIEERIERITQIFSTFRNPDKETVLTPWRVVNMHLAESLGGYTFYDATYTTPQRLPQKKTIDEITDAVFHPERTLLEINSKTGLYPLYACYSIYRQRLQLSHEDYRTITLRDALAHWDRTLDENIFVLCKTPMARSITLRTLAGFRHTAVHASYYEGLIEALLADKTPVINTLRTPIFWKTNRPLAMKFDAIIGNPPYQIPTDNSRSNPIYNLFIDLSIQLAPKVTLITPARYLFNVGMTPKAWNQKVLNDPNYRVVWYRANSQEVFPSADIKGGVAVMYYDKQQNFGAIEHFTAFPELNSIAHKVATKRSQELTEIVFAETSSRFNVLDPEVNQIVQERVYGNRVIKTNAFEDLPDLFTEERKEGDVGFYGLFKRERCYRYIDRRYIEEHPNLEKWKVFVPESNGSGAIGEVLSTPLIGEPLIGATQTFLSIGAFDSREEAEACLKYVKTKFARTLLGILKATQHNPKDTWRLIPLQDFTATSDIDWSQSVADIDRQLYKKYGLTAEEIAFIEEKVRPME